jgi:glycine cleavage system protein P-like pyridoxal-binding family
MENNVSYEKLLDRARMMLAFGVNKGDVLKKLIDAGEEPSLAYLAVIGATVLIGREDG